ncbi:alpha-1A adrenergic receptor-like [Antedon mediterranea]|uniref:alpha-1A adrenergic receptor-like n=1 Tax=Antedon mediterranea TaxID=105859 RepID=UPI003AF6C4C8
MEVEVVATVCTVILFVFGLIGNTSIIALFFKVRSLQTVSNTLVTCLAVTDLIATVLYPIQCLVDIKVLNNNPECMAFFSVIILVSIAHTFFKLSLSVERYITISRPLTYSTILTERRCYIAIVIFTGYSVTIGVLPVMMPLFGNTGSLETDCRLATVFINGYTPWIFANWIIPLPVIVALYIRVFILVKRHVKRIQASEVTSQICAQNSGFKLRREAKTALLLFSMVVYFVIVWIPLIILILNTDPSERVMGYIITHFLTYSTSAVSPLIFGFGNKQYRRHFLSILKRRNIDENQIDSVYHAS